MELIIDFYKGLDTLNLIIFWGVIIVIILLLVFAFILINKNKKLKKLINIDKKDNEENLFQKELEIPVKQEEVTKSITIENTKKEEEKEIVLPPIPEMPKEEEIFIDKPLETEKKFVAEEHVMEYNNDLFSLSNIKKNEDQAKNTTNAQPTETKILEIPTGPYQRNVLREMSLSQTSPIGINRQERKEEKKVELAKDLEESLNNKQEEIFLEKEEITRENPKLQEINNEVKKELKEIENISPRKTEIKTENIIVTKPEEKETKVKEQENKTTEPKKINNDYIDPRTKELLNREMLPKREKLEKTSSEKYLEEVSRKLAEAEIPDEIERTNYELKQEEDAIISYKELMEKKDSIQTIDEEEAIISIEELMNRGNQKEEQEEIEVITKEESKLYNISEDEENDNFLKELKQFRNDL